MHELSFDVQTDRQGVREEINGKWRKREGGSEREGGRERELEKRENSNSKTSFYRDSSLGSVKNLSNN